jgi:hypothetical protein
MKRFFMLCLLVVIVFFFSSCRAGEWAFVEEAVLKSVKYHKGGFSVSPYWELVFEGGAIMRINASRNQMLFVGKTYEIFYKKETTMRWEHYSIRLKK